MAAENKHTPGPWGSGFDSLNNWFSVQDTDARMVVIVKARGNREHAEAEANARLIAAAPALLDALRDARNDILYAYERERSAGPMSRYGARLKFIDAAIALAEGTGDREIG